MKLEKGRARCYETGLDSVSLSTGSYRDVKEECGAIKSEFQMCC